MVLASFLVILEALSKVGMISVPSLETVPTFFHPFLWADLQNLIPVHSDMGSINQSAHDLQMGLHFFYLQLPKNVVVENICVGCIC